MSALISAANLASNPIEEGDAGIILRKNGTFQIFNTHAVIDPENLTSRQTEQGEILMAFSLALQIPQVMNLLKDMSNDPNIIDSIFDKGAAH